MKKNIDRKQLLIVLGLILFATVSRFALPPIFGHVPNFAPMDAIALFSGAYIGRKFLAFLIPLLAIWLSDIFVNFSYYHHFVLFYEGFFWQYAAYLLIVLLGFFVHEMRHETVVTETEMNNTVPNSIRPLKDKLYSNERVNAPRILVGSVTATLVFFVVSNFGAFLSPMYPHTISGLGACYLAALPFLPHTLMSDLVYCSVLFGLIEGVREIVRKRAQIASKSASISRKRSITF